MKKSYNLHGLGLLENGAMVVMTTSIMAVQTVPVIHGASHLTNLMRTGKYGPGVTINTNQGGTMGKPVQITNAATLGQAMKKHLKEQEKAIKEFKENGGICLYCGKKLGDSTSTLNPMHCKECNEETEQLLKQLRGPGFFEL